MSRRKTVKLNLEVVLPLIKQKCRSNVVFCEKMGRSAQKTWVTGWSNKPKPKNPPSPEEAARMCILLHTTPEEILQATGETEQETAKCQADIVLVRSLMEQQGVKEAPAAEGAYVPSYEDWEKQAENWTDDQLMQAMRKLLDIQDRRRNNER